MKLLILSFAVVATAFHTAEGNGSDKKGLLPAFATGSGLLQISQNREQGNPAESSELVLSEEEVDRLPTTYSSGDDYEPVSVPQQFAVSDTSAYLPASLPAASSSGEASAQGLDHFPPSPWAASAVYVDQSTGKAAATSAGVTSSVTTTVSFDAYPAIVSAVPPITESNDGSPNHGIIRGILQQHRDGSGKASKRTKSVLLNKNEGSVRSRLDGVSSVLSAIHQDDTRGADSSIASANTSSYVNSATASASAKTAAVPNKENFQYIPVMIPVASSNVVDAAPTNTAQQRGSLLGHILNHYVGGETEQRSGVLQQELQGGDGLRKSNRIGGIIHRVINKDDAAAGNDYKPPATSEGRRGESGTVNEDSRTHRIIHLLLRLASNLHDS